MYKRLFLVASLSLLLAACGGSSSNSDNDSSGTDNSGTDNSGTDNSGTDNSGTDNSGTDNSGTDTGSTGTYKCSATVASDVAYDDVFIANNTADRDWGAGQDLQTVEGASFVFLITDFTVGQIAQEFNAARALDPTINEKLKMPTQVAWDNMSSGEKALYLVNSERCARGILPFEGIAPSLEGSASTYAAELALTRVLSHGEDGDALARIVAAGATTGTDGSADFTSKSESLAMNQVNNLGGADYLDQHEIEAKAIYDWLYDDIEDQGDGYGHRQHVLLNNYQENSGESGSEGLFGMASDVIKVDENGGKVTEAWTVMHSFDPNAAYVDMASVTSAPDLMGPESQNDCLGQSTFTESQDTEGNNTSTCE